MRKGPDFDFETVTGASTFDWKENGNEILKVVDEALKTHGLEIVTHETESDFYAFSIEPIKR